jgi:hypothetical protein
LPYSSFFFLASQLWCHRSFFLLFLPVPSSDLAVRVWPAHPGFMLG